MFIVMVLFNRIHPSQITDLYQKQGLDSTMAFSLDETRQRYLNSEERTV